MKPEIFIDVDRKEIGLREINHDSQGFFGEITKETVMTPRDVRQLFELCSALGWIDAE